MRNVPKKFKFVQFQNNLFKFCASQVVKSMVKTTASIDNFKKMYNLHVTVRGNNVDQALKVLKMQRGGFSRNEAPSIL